MSDAADSNAREWPRLVAGQELKKARQYMGNLVRGAVRIQSHDADARQRLPGCHG